MQIRKRSNQPPKASWATVTYCRIGIRTNESRRLRYSLHIVKPRSDREFDRAIGHLVEFGGGRQWLRHALSFQLDPVRIATRSEDLRVDPTTIVTDEQSHFPWQVFDFNFNFRGS
jgi:hypothetical protein